MSRKSCISVVIFVVVAFIIGVFSYYTPWLGDDINYAYDFREDHRDEVVSSFSQIIQSLNAHYLTINGRHFPHFAVQYFCGIAGHLPFAIANAVAYIVFLLILCRICSVKLDNVKGVLSVTLLFLLVFQTKMVPSCQIGYIWTFALGMIFVLLFFSQRSMNGWWQIILLGLFSLIAGNGNEALTLGISGALIIYWFGHIKTMSLRQYVMMVCFGIGTLIICLSPASQSRAAESSGGISVSWIVGNLYYFLKTVKAGFIMVAILLWKKFRDKQSIKQMYADNAFWFNVWVIMMAFNTLIGLGSNRQVFGAELAAIIISIKLLKNRSMNDLWLILSAAMLILVYVAQSRYIGKTNGLYSEIERQYVESDDGVIYVDIDSHHYVPFSMEFCPTVQCYGNSPFYKYNRDCLAKWLTTCHGVKNGLKILPTFMRNMETEEMESAIYPVDSQNGLSIVILNENDDKKLYVEREIDLLFIHKTFEPLEIDTKEFEVSSGNNWTASYVDTPDYNVMNISKEWLILK